jgi:hypothetical protein
MDEQGIGQVKWRNLPKIRVPKLDEVGGGPASAVPTA